VKRIAWPAAIVEARAQFARRWAALAPRERLMVRVATTVVALGLGWATLVQPALSTLREVPPRIDAIDAQLQQMQHLAGEAKELRALPPVQPEQARTALQAATDRLGPNAKLALQGDRAVLTLTGVPGPALVAWLGEARSAARARPDEARLSAGAGGYVGTIAVTLPRRP
jgi:general secretion pathway protein M